MAASPKILGQATGLVETILYTVPAGMSATISTLSIANVSASIVTYTVAVRPSGTTITAMKHFLCSGVPVNANDAVFLTIGLTLSAGDVVVVSANNSNVAFGLFGAELG